VANKAKRRIKSANIKLVSLCPKGMNGVASILKERAADALPTEAVAKAIDGYLYAIVYAPNTVDHEGDFADADTVKQMAHDYLLHKEGSGIDLIHSCDPLQNTKVQICETFIVQKGDPRFADIKTDSGTPFDPTGSWAMVIKIHDPALLALYATGEWVGVSMYGSAHVEPVEKQQENETVDQKTLDALDAMLAKREVALVAALAKALTPAAPATPPVPAPVAVPFEGDPTSLEDLAKHADRVLFASLDMSKTADIAKWAAHLEAKAKKAAPKSESDKQIEALQAQINKLRGAPASGNDPDLSKQDLTPAQKMAAGAAFMRKMQGRPEPK
jgi:hypothetical protein